MSMLPQLQSPPRFLPARFKGQEEGWEPHLHRHHFTFLSASWLKPTQHSTDHTVSHHKAEGTWDSTASKDQPLSRYRPHGSSFLLWKGCCKSTPGGIQIQWLHCKTCLKEEIVTSPKQLYETAGVPSAGPTKMVGKPSQGVSLTQSTELLEEVFRLCLVIVLPLLFRIKMLKTELCPRVCLQLIKGFV